MFPKVWKSLFLAPLAVTLVTGCGDRKHSDTPTSRYSGYWLERNAARDFEISKKGRSSEESYSILCRRALDRRSVHGLPTRSRANAVQVKAYYVTGNGAVYRWAPGFTLSDPEMSTVQFIGQVNEDGNLPHSNAALGPQNQPWLSGQQGQRSILQMASDGQSLAVIKPSSGYQGTYLRVSRADLDIYTSNISRCALESNLIQTQPVPHQSYEDYGPDQGDWEDVPGDDYSVGQDDSGYGPDRQGPRRQALPPGVTEAPPRIK